MGFKQDRKEALIDMLELKANITMLKLVCSRYSDIEALEDREEEKNILDNAIFRLLSYVYNSANEVEFGLHQCLDYIDGLYVPTGCPRSVVDVSE